MSVFSSIFLNLTQTGLQNFAQEKMNVLFVSNGLGRGGKERQIHEILSHINRNNEFECALLLRRPVIDYDVSRLKNVKFFIPEKELSVFQFVKFLSDSCKEFQPDVIHTWESWVTISTHIYRLTRLKRLKVVDGSLRYAKSFSKADLHYWSARIGRMLSSRVIANSSAGLMSIDYARRGKYVVVTNAIDTERFQKFQRVTRNERPFTLSMVASFTRAKDYATLIQTVSEMIEDGYDLRCNLIGDGVERSKMMTMVPIHQVNNFQFTGIIEDPERLLQESNVGILLSRKGHSEGYSNTVMEIVASGLPVIVTNTGGNPEMVFPEKNGFLIDHESKQQLREAIHTLYESPALCERMGIESRIFAENEFSMKRLVVKLIAIYKSLL